MTATGHALVGAAIATQIQNPLIGLPVAFVLHYVFDKLPHWDPMTDKHKSRERVLTETIADVLIGFSLVAVIFVALLRVTNPLYILTAAFVSQLPDWMEAPHSLFKMKVPIFTANYKVQSWVHHIWFDSRLAAPWGVVTQVIVVAIFIFWAFRLI